MVINSLREFDLNQIQERKKLRGGKIDIDEYNDQFQNKLQAYADDNGITKDQAMRGYLKFRQKNRR